MSIICTESLKPRCFALDVVILMSCSSIVSETRSASRRTTISTSTAWAGQVPTNQSHLTTTSIRTVASTTLWWKVKGFPADPNTTGDDLQGYVGETKPQVTVSYVLFDNMHVYVCNDVTSHVTRVLPDLIWLVRFTCLELSSNPLLHEIPSLILPFPSSAFLLSTLQCWWCFSSIKRSLYYLSLLPFMH